MKTFRYAIVGIKHLVASQRNAQIHLGISCIVVAAGFFFKLSIQEWCWIILAMMIVWAAEGLNTAIEFLADAVSKENHPLIEKSKDMAAGAVLICAIGAVVIGILIFYPHLFL